MVAPLVETKLLLPRPRRKVVLRPRLADLLLRGSQGPVTLVSAPAGFGKTTLLASWFATAPSTPEDDHLVAWVSLDERDREATSFWTYVLLALDRAVPGSGAGALTLLQSGQATVEAVLAGVVNELSVHSGEVTVVLDDYHLAEGVEVTAGMTFLVDHLPPQLRLVIGTRADPALPLSRLRARGELVEIRATDLRFTREEVSSYLNDLNGLNLTTTDLAALEDMEAVNTEDLISPRTPGGAGRTRRVQHRQGLSFSSLVAADREGPDAFYPADPPQTAKPSSTLIWEGPVKDAKTEVGCCPLVRTRPNINWSRHRHGHGLPRDSPCNSRLWTAGPWQ